MTYIKLLTVLTTLALLTACGGGTAETADKTSGDTDTGGGNATDCTPDPFHADCLTNTGAITLRRIGCLADIMIDDSCRGEDGIVTVFCKANPFDIATPCVHEDYDDERQTMCLANITTNPLCMGAQGIATLFCMDNPFDTSNACMHNDYFPSRVLECITAGNANSNDKCDTLFTASASNTCLTNPFTDACTSDRAFINYAATARTNRKSFCASDNTGSSLCTALTACQTNPLDPTCGAYFEPERIMHCASNPDIASCPNVTSGDWADSFTDTLATAQASTGTANGFLSGLTDTPPVVTGFSLASDEPPGNTLTLADNGLGGDATDRASFFWGGG